MATLADMLVMNSVLATVLALVAFTAGKVGFVKRRPRLLHALWVVVLLKFMFPSPLTFKVVGVPANSPTSMSTSPGQLTMFPIHPATGIEVTQAPVEHDVAQYLRCVWLIGTLTVWGLAFRQIRHVSSLLKRATIAPPNLRHELQRISRRFGFRRCPALRLARGRISPMFWCPGFVPVILLPEDFLEQLDGQKRDSVFAHELAHYHRRDHWMRWFELVMVGLFWWHPVAWWCRRQLRQAEELCCDAIVIETFPGCEQTYAETLLQAVEFVSVNTSLLPQVASGLGNVNSLIRRIEMVSNSRLSSGLSRRMWFAVYSFAVCCLLITVGDTWAVEEDSSTDTIRRPATRRLVVEAGDRVVIEVDSRAGAEKDQGQDTESSIVQPRGPIRVAIVDMERVFTSLDSFQCDIDALREKIDRFELLQAKRARDRNLGIVADVTDEQDDEGDVDQVAESVEDATKRFLMEEAEVFNRGFTRVSRVVKDYANANDFTIVRNSKATKPRDDNYRSSVLRRINSDVIYSAVAKPKELTPVDITDEIIARLGNRETHSRKRK